MSTGVKTNFLTRFDQIWAQARRVQLSQAVCWAVLTLLAGIALLAAADYWLELPLALRIAAAAAICVGSVAVAISLAVQSVRQWRRQATAAAIEKVFPQLGQRIRTTVQYGELSDGEIEHEGVATTLVAALEADTAGKAQPLPLDAVVPWKSLAVASLLAAVVGLSLAGLSAFDWQWRAAAKRAFLADDPYTQLTVEPGHLTLKEGESTQIRVTVAGRTGKQVTFFSRRTDEADAQWQEETLPIQPVKDPTLRQATADIPLDRVRHPLEYRVAAGSVASETYRVDVLYPLKIVKIQTSVQPPEYTGQGAAVSEGGNIAALAGSQVKLLVELDRPASEAWIELYPVVGRRDAQAAAPQKLPLVIDGTKLAAELELATDLTYAVFATAADNMELPENKYRIRVRQDEPPQVWFESPSEALEVHTLAEILMRIRVSDDYGLSRTGVMFEVNNEDEYPLLAEDFAAATEELTATGKLSPQTRATLEKMLPLEHFELSQQDSVMYYAFAEDIRPSGAQRTESDLRFVDIRPFRREYRLVDSADGMPGGQGPQLKSLEELIGRQRYALNRTLQLARRFAQSGQADVAGVDSTIKFEGELAKFTRELAEGLEARGIDETELLYQAEAAMLGATDSLSAGNYDTATLQEREALKNLIEGRDRIRMSIEKNPDKQQLAALRAFDRLQRQKLRRPKSDEEEAREVARRLAELADREDFVYETIAALDGSAAQPQQPMSPSEGTSGAGQTTPQEGAPPTEDQPAPGEPMPAEPAPDKTAATREELEDKQADIAADAREIEKVLGRLGGVSDLAKERMAAVSKVAEDGSAALGRGAMEEARGAAGAAREQFRELAQQVEALLAQEQVDRIAAAERLAADLARQQQDFADKLAKSEATGGLGDPPPKQERKGPGLSDKPLPNEPADGDKEKQMQGLGGAAEKIADRAQTLADVLAAAARADNPAEQETGTKVQEVVQSMGIGELTERLKDLPGQMAGGKLEDAKATAGDGAERLEATAEQLSVLHRSIVAPQVDELAKVEQQLAALDERLDRLDTPTQITAWHMDAEDLLDELEKAGVPDQMRQEFVEELKKGGWGPDARTGRWNWSRIEGSRYAAPGGYRVQISRVLDTVRNRMQELLLGDIASSRDEPIPPQYQELVDRYHQILATEGKGKLKVKSGDK